MTKNTSSTAIFKIASLVSVMSFSGLCAIEFSDYHKQLAAMRAVTQGTKVVTCENEIHSLLALADDITEEQAIAVAQGVSVKVNGYAIPACESRKIPIQNNGKYTLDIHNEPGLIKTIASCMEKSSNALRAAAFSMVSRIIDLGKWRFTYECDHDGNDEQYVSNMIIGNSQMRALIDQPKGLFATLREFARQTKISWCDWFHVQFELSGQDQEIIEEVV